MPAPSTLAQSAAGDGEYAAFEQGYFTAIFEREPGEATSIGVHTYDGRLPDLSAAAFARNNVRDHENLAALLRIESLELSARRAVDAKALELDVRDRLLRNETMQFWRHRPSIYVDSASNAIFALATRPFAPADARLRNAVTRENAIPRLFAQAKENLGSIDATSAQIAREDALGAASFLGTDVPKAFAGVGDASLQKAFRISTRRATSAANDFARWLSHFVVRPKGTYAIGAANYSAMLRYEADLEMPLAQYLAIGQSALHATRDQMVAVAHRIDPTKNVRDVLAEVSKRHPTADGLLTASRGDLNRLRRFILQHKIIAIPPNAKITVVETPPFMRSTTTAAMNAPGPLEEKASRGYFYVTPVDPHDKPAAQQAYLEAFNDFERPIVAAHEVYPGHYVNFMLDRKLPLSLTERLIMSDSFVEGWAHYCEQMIVDEGWGNGDPRVRLMQLKEAIWRNARYVAGVKLHTSKMSVAQAERFFERAAFLDPVNARIEAKRGTQDPLYGYYTLGKLEILKLRSDYKKKLGSKFTLAGFHAALLQYGDFAVPLLRPLLLGSDDDGKIL